MKAESASGGGRIGLLKATVRPVKGSTFRWGLYAVSGERHRRRLVRVGAADPSLTRPAALTAVSVRAERLDIAGVLGERMGRVKRRARGLDAAEVLLGVRAGLHGRLRVPPRTPRYCYAEPSHVERGERSVAPSTTT